MSACDKTPIKVAQIASFDVGGAFIAANRLHRAVCALGHESRFYLLQARGHSQVESSRPTRFQQFLNILRPHLDRGLLELAARHRKGKFSAAWLPNSRLQRLARTDDFDLLHLHWLGDGFIPVEGLRQIRQPIVWTLHDMWAFTGGCYYDSECGRFAVGCGCCPVLRSQSQTDLSSWVLRRKLRAWKDLNLTLVAPSRWMADEARRSLLFRNRRIEIIPSCLDVSVFKPVQRTTARQLLNLPQDRSLILFGALKPQSEPRKGYALFQEALSKLRSQTEEDIDIVMFGGDAPRTWQSEGFTWHSLRTLHDEVSLALVYSAADVFVAPSLQDNLPNTVLESLACGTPVVGSNVGGLPDMVTSRFNGYLACVTDAADFAYGIRWVLKEVASSMTLRENARNSVLARYTPASIAGQYLALYQELLGRCSRDGSTSTAAQSDDSDPVGPPCHRSDAGAISRP